MAFDARSPRLIAIIAAVMAALLVGGYALDRRASSVAMAEARDVGADDAEILAAGLQAELDKFTLAPLVLAEDPEVRAMVASSKEDSTQLNRRFEALAAQTDAAAIYLMNSDGLTVAASNWRLPTSFVGSNYKFRTYFVDAMRVGHATQFALGTVSRKPGLYVAQAVRERGNTVGVVALKVEFDRLERSWRETTPGVFVTDRDGVILITSDERWRFHTTRPETASERDHSLDRRQFGTARLAPLALGRTEGRQPLEWLDVGQPISLPGWRLHLLVDPSERVAAAVAEVRYYLLLAVAALAASVIGAVAMRSRREARAESLVAARTHDLREQLGQANRLALLGQVTAGVGHEINQPVAAAQVYAESGQRLLDAGRTEEARANFERIVGIAQRIGAITGELRRFGRRGAAEPASVPVGDPIDGALLLLHDRIVRSGVRLILPSDAERSIVVRSEAVRLEQVIVNLLQNALDAMPPDGTVTLMIGEDRDMCTLTVADDGPGLGEIGERIFQPFATTKVDGLGLGLVISRDIMRDLGGDLVVEPGDHGARFAMRIPKG